MLDDLEHGVTSIELGTPATAWGLDELRDALEGVLLDIAPVVLAPHTDLGSARPSWISRGHGMPSRAAARLDQSGRCPSRSVGAVDQVAEFAASIADTHPNVVACTIDTTRYVDAGADEVQEIAWMLATGVAMLDRSAAGLPVERAATIGWVAAAADQFLTIARLQRPDPCGVRYSPPVESTPVSRFHAVTSPAMFAAMRR